jgi:heme exporter protein D
MWTSWSQFFAMSGYGLYVWGSMGMCLLVVLVELLQLALRRRAALRAALDNRGESQL